MMIRAAKEKPESGDERRQKEQTDHQPEPGLTRLNIGKDAELLQGPAFSTRRPYPCVCEEKVKIL